MRPKKYPYTKSQWDTLYKFNHETFHKEPYLLNRLTGEIKDKEVQDESKI